jgi:hypothetical protein
MLLLVLGGERMRNTLMLGDLICCLYEEYRQLYGDNELAALAADVALNDLLMQLDVQELMVEEEMSEFSPLLGFN